MTIARTALALKARALVVVQAAAPLAVRLLLGHAFLLAGLGKWRHFDGTVEFFASLGLPAPAANAAFIASLEVVGGIGLLLGLGTRVFAALLSATMTVALLTAERGSLVEALSGGDKSPSDVVALVYLLFLGTLVAFGPGALALDRLLVRPLSLRVERWLGAPLSSGAAAR